MTAAAAPKAHPTLVHSSRALAALGGVALAATGECEPFFLGVFSALFLLGLWIERLPSVARLMAKLQPVMAAIILGVGLLDFFYLSNSFLLSVAHFLLCLQGLRLLVMRTHRENLGSVLLSSLMILSASTLAVDWTFLLMLVLFLPAVIWTLMLHTVLEDDREAAAAGPEGAPDLIRPAVWRRIVPVLRTSAALAFFVAASCCAFVFVLFPRFNFQGFRGEFLQPVHKTGFTSQVDLKKSGSIYTDNGVVMRIEIDPKDRDLWTGYIRGAALEVMEGRTWKRAPYSPDRLFHAGRSEIRLPEPESPGDGTLHQTVYLESMDTPLLFAAPQPVSLDIDRPFIEWSDDGAVQRRIGDAWRVKYEVVSRVSDPRDPARAVDIGRRMERRGRRWNEEPPAAFARSARVLGAATLDSTRALPAPPLPSVAALAEQVTQGSRDQLEQALRIQRYLRDHYTYTLDMGPPDAGDPLERFLFRRKAGHCEFFASAMATMLRYRGIRSRVVTGFLSNEWNSRGHYYIVRMKNAHAWVEAAIDGAGWIAFDPSPRDDGRNLDDSTMARRVSQAWDYLNLRWNRYILSYDFEKQVAVIRSVTNRSRQISVRLDGVLAPFRRSVPGWGGRGPRPMSSSRLPWAAIAAVIAASVALGAFVAWRRRRRAVSVWFYPRLVRFLEDRAGSERTPSQSVGDLLSAAGPRLGESEADARRLAAAYERIRFGGEPVTDSERKEIGAALRRLR